MSEATLVLALSVLGGAAFLDRTALVQTMMSRPLVSGTLAGFLAGAPGAGMACGALLELLWLFDLPVGTSVPPDESTAGVVGAAVAAVLVEGWGLAASAGAGVAAGVAAGILGGRADVWVRRWNDGLVTRAREALAAGRVDGVGRFHWLGVLRFFGVGAAVSLVGVAAGRWGASALAGLGPGLRQGFELAGVTLPVVGAAACLGGLRSVRARPWFVAGLAAAGLGARLLLWAREGVPWRS